MGEGCRIRGEINCALSVRVGRGDCLLRREVMTICDREKGYCLLGRYVVIGNEREEGSDCLLGRDVVIVC